MRTEPNLRTEQHLRTALAAREDLVPDPDPILAGARAAATRHRRRRATATAVAAAGVMVAGVLTVPAVLAGSPTPEPEPQQPGAAPPVALPAAEPYDPAQPRPPYTFTVPAGPLAGLELQPVTVAPEFQVAELHRPGEPEPAATLVVYDPGARTRTGTGGEVNLRWEYAPDGYAEITSPVDAPLDEETVQGLADSLELVAPYPAKVPYRLDYLPAGATPFNVGQYTAEPGVFRSVMQVETDSLTLDISISDQSTDIDDPDWDWQTTSIAGRPAECVELIDGNRCRVEFDEFTVNVGTDDRAEIERVVAGLQPATWEDPATWYELDDALPGE